MTKKKKKQKKTCAASPAAKGGSGFAPGKNPHKGMFVVGLFGGWAARLEVMMAEGLRE